MRVESTRTRGKWGWMRLELEMKDGGPESKVIPAGEPITASGCLPTYLLLKYPFPITGIIHFSYIRIPDYLKLNIYDPY